jgi:iron(III) transport system substrate-binding protein
MALRPFLPASSRPSAAGLLSASRLRRYAKAFGTGALFATIGLASAMVSAEEINIYSSRHYDTDEALYATFTAKTGIEVNRIEGEADALIQRIVSEGSASPADILVTVDAGRLWRADQAGILGAVDSALLKQRIPESLRHPEGHWFGYSTRARVIFVDPERVQHVPSSYLDLADPRYAGQICIRSSSNMYNLSLLGSIIAHHGAEKAEAWARGVVANMARPPKGGDTDQIKAVAAGECALAVGNTYYYVRLARSDDAGDKAIADKVKLIWPEGGDGVHRNVSGAGLVKTAPNRAAAIKFLEYLASDEAQRYFADGNNEYPAVEGALENPVLVGLGMPRFDSVNVAVYGENQPEAQRIFDRAGWK